MKQIMRQRPPLTDAMSPDPATEHGLAASLTTLVMTLVATVGMVTAAVVMAGTLSMMMTFF